MTAAARTPSRRGAIYLRVSTREQTIENQEREPRQWADCLGLEVVAVYADTVSGARSDRAALANVLAGAHRRDFGVLLVWALDRLSREGIRPMLRYLDKLRAAGVRSSNELQRSPGSTRPGRLPSCCLRSSPGSPNRSESASLSGSVPATLEREPPGFTWAGPGAK